MLDRPDQTAPNEDSPPPVQRRSWVGRWRLPLIGSAVAVLAAGGFIAISPSAQASVPFAVESLDGSGNNAAHPTWGQSGLPYLRVGPAKYTDGISVPFGGPNPRQVSNRIFNDKAQNVFSERRVSNWGWTWGQFLDHTFGLRDSAGATATAFNIPFSSTDALEEFHSNVGSIAVNRSTQSAGTGTSTSNPRQQTNTLSSYVDANTVYGATNARLDWLRTGSLDGNPANNSALLMLPGGYLPARDARGNAAAAPAMDSDGRLLAKPNTGVVAGDARANENIALTATHTLFAREHNRIVSLLPNTLSDEDKFQIARRVVIAEEQYITYQEWLPAMGVSLPKYAGYNANVNATLSNEFATVGYRAHTQLHGDGLEVDDVNASRYSAADIANLEAQGLEVADNGDGTVSIDVPMGVMFFNPTLLKTIQLGPVLKSLEGDPQYNNDAEIDNQLRSTLFQVPSTSDATCLNGPTLPNCFKVVNDLGAIDIQRNRDHGIGTINQVRQAYGLSAYTSFTQLTGESTETLPSGTTINSPSILDTIQLKDVDGRVFNQAAEPDSLPMSQTRRATVAAKLKAIYGSVGNVDAFVGIFAEPHVPGSEMGQTQLAIWQKQFQALRDGDRFYFGNDQGLSFIKNTYGIDFHRTLGEIIQLNSDVTAADINSTGNVFFLADNKLPTGPICSVDYDTTQNSATSFTGTLGIKNTSNQTISGWQLQFALAQGQQRQSNSGISITQSGSNGIVWAGTNVSTNGTIAPGQTRVVSFTATFDGLVNQKPGNFLLNSKRCTLV
jgi:hypothetical protein